MRKERSVLNYSLWVWLSSVLTAPILFFLQRFYGTYMYTLMGLLSTFVLMVSFGLVFSIPSFIVFFLSVKFINKRDWLQKIKKRALVLSGAVIACATFCPILANNLGEDKRLSFGSTDVQLTISYTLTIIAGTVLYRLKTKSLI
jgi:hypothetical protein